MTLRYHAVLAVVSHGCPPPRDRFLRVTHPSATAGLLRPCDLHVLSMPPAFTLSQDQTLRFISVIIPKSPKAPRTTTSTNRPELMVLSCAPSQHLAIPDERTEQSKRTVTHKEYIAAHPSTVNQQVQVPYSETRTSQSGQSTRRLLAQTPQCVDRSTRAPPTYPFLAYSQVKERSEDVQSPVTHGPTGRLAL